MNHSKLRAMLAIALSAGLVVGPAAAHNAHVHQPMTDLAYQVMRMVEAAEPSDIVSFPAGGGITAFPTGGSQAEWQSYIQAIQAAVPKLRALPAGLPAQSANRCFPPPSTEPPPDWAQGQTLGALQHAVHANYLTGSAFDCGINKGYSPGPAPAQWVGGNDYTGTGLGFWAQHIDDEVDDFHGFIKPLNAGGLGYLKGKLSEAWDQGWQILLVPLVCLGSCLFGLFGDCDDCISNAKKAAQGTNPVTNLESILPGFGDFSGPTYTGLWHFINMRNGASNDYDDRQGMFYEEAGPFGVPGVVDMGIMITADAIGLTVNADDSRGVSRYQIQAAGDGHPNTSPIRGTGQWEVTTIGHVPFEPVDNLGFFGWREFRKDPNHSARWLAWPLHALGDATVPMHATGTTSWGHRPYEDAQERLYAKIVGADKDAAGQLALLRQVLLRGFGWYRFITAWRAQHGSSDVPVRELVTAVARNTHQTSGVGMPWPYNDSLSLSYMLADDTSTGAYEIYPGAVGKSRPLMFDGIGAKIAFLTAAMETLP